MSNAIASEINPLNQDSSSSEQRPSSFALGAKRPSSAYLNSKKRNDTRTSALENAGVGPLDFEYRDGDDETQAHVALDFKNTTSVTVMQKIRKIGKKTTCMAFCLLGFGIAMCVTSFLFTNHIGDNGFILFLIIGICAIIPGSYATYNVVGKYLGWYKHKLYIPSCHNLSFCFVGRALKMGYRHMTDVYTCRTCRRFLCTHVTLHLQCMYFLILFMSWFYVSPLTIIVWVARTVVIAIEQ
jgi:hypothetical protein